MSRIYRTGLIQQPSQFSVIDWSNPITRGLTLADKLNTPTHDHLGRSQTVVGTKRSASQVGIVSGFGATSGVGSTDSIATNLTAHATQRTYFCLALANGSGAGGGLGRMFDKRVAGIQVELLFRDDSAGVTNYGRLWTGNGQWSIANPSAGVWHAYGVRYDASSTENVPSIFVDGVLQTITASTTPTGTLTNGTDAYVIGNRKNDNARAWAGQIACLFVWDRLLSDAEMVSIYRNPWQIFKANSSRLFIPTAAPAATAYTLIAQGGTYSLSGQQVSLNRNRVLSASGGDYSLTGQNAVIYRNRVLSTQGGSYTVNGQQVSITKVSLYPPTNLVLVGTVYGPGGIYTGTYDPNKIKIDINTGNLIKPISDSIVMSL